MPYFSWRGIDLQGKNRKGILFARSGEHLDAMLLKRDIALINSKISKPLIIFPLSLAAKINFFSRLATLLEAGVHLPKALVILAESTEHPSSQEMLIGIERQVEEGKALHESLSAYPQYFNPMMIHMIYVGQEASSLPLALKMLTLHLETKDQFYKKIRSAALVPALTLLFFISITLIIFIVIMPLFSTIFESMRQEVPTVTRWLMGISNFLSSLKALVFAIALVITSVIAYRWVGKERRKRFLDKLVLKVPGVRQLAMMSSCYSFFQSVAILLQGGMQLVPALKIGNEAIGNHILADQVKPLVRSVASGCSLSQALVQHPGPFSRSDIEAAIAVGQESGNLSSMLYSIAQDYKERTERMLTLYSSLFQPVVMIVLGVFIALLIVAVYIPILTLSSAIS